MKTNYLKVPLALRTVGWRADRKPRVDSWAADLFLRRAPRTTNFSAKQKKARIAVPAPPGDSRIRWRQYPLHLQSVTARPSSVLRRLSKWPSALCDPCIPHGVIRFQHRRKINCGSPSQALTPYFFRFLWCRRIGHDADRSPLPERRGNNAPAQPMIASKLELSPCAVSVLGQLFVEGPTSDNNITSRAGRCD